MSNTNKTANTQNCTTIGAFERNRFFYGKFLSVDDFQTEQDYFREKIRLLSKTLEGSGIISGLEVSNVEINGSDLSVQINAGYALDCCGNLIIIDHTKSHTVSNPFNDDTVYLYVYYDECDKDQVASMNESSSCEENCDYNRTLETFKLVFDNHLPQDINIDDDCIVPTMMCEHEGVLIAVFKKNGAIYEVDNDRSQKLPQRLLSNAQLAYHLCLHENKTDNPHHVTADQVGAIISINTVQNAGGNIDLTSKDSSIKITANDAENTVNLEVSETILNEINAEIALMKANLRMVLRFLMDKALKYKLKAFSSVLEHFESKTAVEIVKVVREAIDKRVYLSEKDFVSLMSYLTDLETELVDEIGDAAVPERMEHYRIAIDGLKEAIEKDNVFAIAVAQDEVCEMAEWLLPVIEKVKVPKITTLSIENAKAKLAGVGLLIGNISVQVSDKPENSVLKQDPKTGTEVEKGSQVNVVVAVKPEKVRVPNVTGLYSHMAYTVLNDSKLVAGKISEEISDAAPGTVLKQQPKAGTEVDPGSAVEMTIAKAPEMTMVPGIIELSRDEAVEVLAKAKLSLGQVREQVSDAELGTVLEQTPKAGTEVELESLVDVVIAVKPDRVRVPNITGLHIEVANQRIIQVRLTIGTVREQVSDAEPGTVLEQKPRAGTEVEIDSLIDVVIAVRSSGVIVPNLIGKVSTVTARIIEAAGLTLGGMTREISTKPEGTVLRQTPKPGSSVALGTAVSIVVAVGRRISSTTVPNLVKKTAAEVEVLLEKAKLQQGTITPVPSRLPRGTVVSQKPESGKKVPIGSRVDMSVSGIIR